MNTREVGNVTELKAIAKFAELGYSILLPYGSNEKYDFVVVKDNEFIKIQSKTSRLSSKKSINFNTCVTASNYLGSRIKHYTEDDVDFFVTVWEDKVFCIPSKIVLKYKKQFTLILDSKNNYSETRRKTFNFADDYVLD